MSRAPKLPPQYDDGDVTSLRYEVNPAIALNALNDIYRQVQRYQETLRRLVQGIQKIYGEGPVVSGWLASEARLNEAVQHSQRWLNPVQSSPAQQSPAQQLKDRNMAIFRHGDADDLMNYLSALESSLLQGPLTPMPQGAIDPGSQYYLCRLTSGGQIQTELCPPEQVPVLSMAIARYQRLSQLTQQKQAIETKLQKLLDILETAQQILADE